MGYIPFNFLGEKYQISEAINEFLHYDELLTPIRVKILNALSQDIKRDSCQLRFGEEMPGHVENSAKVYIKFIEESANILISKMFALGIYDVTADELLSSITSIADINELKMRTLNTMLVEGQKYVDMKNRGVERAYRSAASNITGSGVMVFSSSITTLMIHSVVERGILLSQAKKADKEYEEAVKAINASTRNALDIMVSEVMVKQYYPSLMDILMQFSTKITSAFLVELVQHDKFDFASIEKYNMRKAEQMLTNINHVPDKADFLRQAFNVCPFSLDVYEKCLEYGLLDRDTFQTAAYFGFADNLVESMEVYISQNLKNKNLIAPIIAILAEHKNTDETEIWKRAYRETIESVENTYRSFNLILTQKDGLGSFVKECIGSDIEAVVGRTEDDIYRSITRKVSSVISESDYSELVGMGLLSPEALRKSGSISIDLGGINSELSAALTVAVMDFISEVGHKLRTYEELNAQFNQEIGRMRAELDLLKSEREKIGFFAFAKKKEMDIAISNKTSQISEYERTSKPKKPNLF